LWKRRIERTEAVEDCEEKGVVVWDQTYNLGKWAIRCRPQDVDGPIGIFSGYSYGSDSDAFLTSWSNDGNVEVVGNVFENR